MDKMLKQRQPCASSVFLQALLLRASKRGRHSKNQEKNLHLLQSKLYRTKLGKRRTGQQATEKARKINIDSQIRNYVFHLYKSIKDTRTDCQQRDVENVLSRDIDNFIRSYLLQH